MTDQVLQENCAEEMATLRRLLNVGAKLYTCRDRQQMLETVLSEARALTRAEAGSLYLVQKDRLRFVAVQNDKMDTSEITRHLLGKELPVSAESLAGYVASTGRIINIPDSYSLPAGAEAPFHINRDLDAKTGYDVRSILAIPLNCPDGECVGVMQLFNRVGAYGNSAPFENKISEGLMSLVSTAAITVHNVSLQEQLRQAHLNTIFRLSAIAEYRDANTSDHIQRVSRSSQLIAEALGLDSEQVELIRYASPMHDVGKVAIPDAILLKPGHLTPAQRMVMQRHTVVGAEILSDADGAVLNMAQDVALHHHERWDGQGYPRGLKGEATSLPGRIVGLADVFDAVVSQRCYKEACSLDVALDILDKDTGKHFDPAIVDAFLGVLDEVLESYPTLKTN